MTKSRPSTTHPIKFPNHVTIQLRPKSPKEVPPASSPKVMNMAWPVTEARDLVAIRAGENDEGESNSETAPHHQISHRRIHILTNAEY